MSTPRLLVMGLRRSGKTSILNVVFNKMPPNDTLFLETTQVVTRRTVLPFVNIETIDFPGSFELVDPSLFQTSILVFVIDSQDDYLEAIQRLFQIVSVAVSVNPTISVEVFIHKVDGLSDESKIETQREIYQRLTDDLLDANLPAVHLSFHLTSIYDHSVFEALSKVSQKLINQLPTLENLLNMLCSNTGIEKTFLFDMHSKIYIATDSSPVDMQSYELCSDMIDVVMDLSVIYNDIRKNSPSQDSSQEYHAGIRLNNGMALYLRRVNGDLALVSLMREESFDRQGVVDYNMRIISSAIADVLKVDS